MPHDIPERCLREAQAVVKKLTKPELADYIARQETKARRDMDALRSYCDDYKKKLDEAGDIITIKRAVDAVVRSRLSVPPPEAAQIDWLKHRAGCEECKGHHPDNVRSTRIDCDKGWPLREAVEESERAVQEILDELVSKAGDVVAAVEERDFLVEEKLVERAAMLRLLKLTEHEWSLIKNNLL